MKISIDKIGIIGYGNMGKLIAQFSSKYLDDQQICCHDPEVTECDFQLVDLAELNSCNLIIISTHSETLPSISEELEKIGLAPDTIVISITAVMTYTEKHLDKLKGKNLNLLMSHPLFGPATLKQNSDQLDGLKLALCNLECDSSVEEKLRSFLSDLGLKVLSTTADQHDRELAYNHFIPFFLSHVLKNVNLPQSEIQTRSVDKLCDFLNHTSFNLSVLKDIYQFNPYCTESFKQLQSCIDDLSKDIGAE